MAKRKPAGFHVTREDAIDAIRMHPKTALAELTNHAPEDVRHSVPLLKERPSEAPDVRLELILAKEGHVEAAFAHLVRHSLERGTFHLANARLARTLMVDRARRPGGTPKKLADLAESMAGTLSYPNFDQIASAYLRTLRAPIRSIYPDDEHP